MLIRIRSRDGMERVSVENPRATVGELKHLIESQLGVPASRQVVSRNQNLLLSKTAVAEQFRDMEDPTIPLAALGIGHGHMLFLAYEGERSVPAPKAFCPAGTFGRKMTIEDLIARQIRIERQETPHCAAVSFDRDAANVFQHYVNETLAFAVKRGGFLYGTVAEDGQVSVHFIYEPPQQGSETDLLLMRDTGEEALVEAIALGLGMRRVGFIFNQTVGQAKNDYTLSRAEVRQAAELHAETDLKEWVTALVKLEVNEDGGADVHFEAFQLSDQCIKYFKDGLFAEDTDPDLDPKITRMNKDVISLGKDTRDVDNDFFLVVVKILDHQGPLSTTFPIENRISPVTLGALKNHLDKAKHLPFVKRISDFHLLLLLARFLDVNADVPQLAACVQAQAGVPEGYEIIIDSLANSGA